MNIETVVELGQKLGYDFEDGVKEATKEQKSIIRDRFSNLQTNGIFYSDNGELIFTSESTWKNWMYYAGFEYIGEEYDMLKSYSQGDFLVVYPPENSRVNDVIDMLEESAVEEEEIND